MSGSRDCLPSTAACINKSKSRKCYKVTNGSSLHIRYVVYSIPHEVHLFCTFLRCRNQAFPLKRKKWNALRTIFMTLHFSPSLPIQLVSLCMYLKGVSFWCWSVAIWWGNHDFWFYGNLQSPPEKIEMHLAPQPIDQITSKCVHGLFVHVSESGFILVLIRWDLAE